MKQLRFDSIADAWESYRSYHERNPRRQLTRREQMAFYAGACALMTALRGGCDAYVLMEELRLATGTTEMQP